MRDQCRARWRMIEGDSEQRDYVRILDQGSNSRGLNDRIGQPNKASRDMSGFVVVIVGVGTFPFCAANSLNSTFTRTNTNCAMLSLSLTLDLWRHSKCIRIE